MAEKTVKSNSRASSSQSRASLVKSIASSSQERKSLEWVDDLLLEELSKQESKSDYASDSWANLVASELTMADVDRKIQEVEEELFGIKTKTSGRIERKSKRKEIEEDVEEFEDEEEDSSEPKFFTFDMGRLDNQVSHLIKLLDNVSFPGGKPMPDAAGTKSVYTATRENMSRFGLQVILNRVAVAFEYVTIKVPKEPGCHGNAVVNITSDATTNIWDKLKGMKMSEALRTLAQRTDEIFAKELGQISGSLLLYPRHVVLMVEGPEICLVDYFTQIYKSSLLERIVKGRVLFVMPHVLIRYFEEWSELEAVPPEREADIAELSNEKERKLLKFFGQKCSYLWRYLRRYKLTGLGRTCDALPTDILPEEELIEMTLDSNLLRPFDQWLFELSTLEDTIDKPFEQCWPETDFVIPDMKPDQYTESLGITVKSENPPPGTSEELEQFLKLSKTQNEELDNKEKSDSAEKDKKPTEGKKVTTSKDRMRQPSIRKKLSSKVTRQQNDVTVEDKTAKTRSSLWKTRKKI